MYYNFKFVDEDGNGEDVNLLVKIDYSGDKKEFTAKIEDAISSYIDSVDDWQFYELVEDVLNSFKVHYEIIDPEEICI